MQYRLHTLLIAVAVVPPLLAGLWQGGLLLLPHLVALLAVTFLFVGLSSFVLWLDDH